MEQPAWDASGLSLPSDSLPDTLPYDDRLPSYNVGYISQDTSRQEQMGFVSQPISRESPFGTGNFKAANGSYQNDEIIDFDTFNHLTSIQYPIDLDNSSNISTFAASNNTKKTHGDSVLVGQVNGFSIAELTGQNGYDVASQDWDANSMNNYEIASYNTEHTVRNDCPDPVNGGESIIYSDTNNASASYVDEYFENGSSGQSHDANAVYDAPDAHTDMYHGVDNTYGGTDAVNANAENAGSNFVNGGNGHMDVYGFAGDLAGADPFDSAQQAINVGNTIGNAHEAPFMAYGTANSSWQSANIAYGNVAMGGYPQQAASVGSGYAAAHPASIPDYGGNAPIHVYIDPTRQSTNFGYGPTHPNITLDGNNAYADTVRQPVRVYDPKNISPDDISAYEQRSKAFILALGKIFLAWSMQSIQDLWTPFEYLSSFPLEIQHLVYIARNYFLLNIILDNNYPESNQAHTFADNALMRIALKCNFLDTTFRQCFYRLHLPMWKSILFRSVQDLRLEVKRIAIPIIIEVYKLKKPEGLTDESWAAHIVTFLNWHKSKPIFGFETMQGYSNLGLEALEKILKVTFYKDTKKLGHAFPKQFYDITPPAAAAFIGTIMKHIFECYLPNGVFKDLPMSSRKNRQINKIERNRIFKYLKNPQYRDLTLAILKEWAINNRKI